MQAFYVLLCNYKKFFLYLIETGSFTDYLDTLPWHELRERLEDLLLSHPLFEVLGEQVRLNVTVVEIDDPVHEERLTIENELVCLDHFFSCFLILEFHVSKREVILLYRSVH